MADLPEWLTADAKLVYVPWLGSVDVEKVNCGSCMILSSCGSPVSHPDRGFQIIWERTGCGGQTHLEIKEDRDLISTESPMISSTIRLP